MTFSTKTTRAGTRGTGAPRFFSPAGWRGERWRHSLVQKYPKLVKPFPGENPRMTKGYARFRQTAPKEFIQSSFKTKRTGGKLLIFGEDKRTGKYRLQSVLIPLKES